MSIPQHTIKTQNGFNNVHDFTQIVVSDSGSGAHEQTRDLTPETPKWTVSDFTSKKEIIKSKMGWGGMPEHLISNELKSGELVPLKLDHFPIRKSQLMIMRKRDTTLGPVGQSLWQEIIKSTS